MSTIYIYIYDISFVGFTLFPLVIWAANRIMPYIGFCSQICDIFHVIFKIIVQAPDHEWVVDSCKIISFSYKSIEYIYDKMLCQTIPRIKLCRTVSIFGYKYWYDPHTVIHPYYIKYKVNMISINTIWKILNSLVTWFDTSSLVISEVLILLF